MGASDAVLGEQACARDHLVEVLGDRQRVPDGRTLVRQAGDATVWNTLAIAQYLDEVIPGARLLPDDRIARAHCRSVSGEMNSGFANLRASLPMNLKAHYPKHRIWGGAKPDIERIVEIWTDCLATYGGPFLFGKQRGMADAMYAPVVTRFLTYDVTLDPRLRRYCDTIMAMPEMREWLAAAKAEPDDIAELDMEF